jgi:hypothetical protein
LRRLALDVSFRFVVNLVFFSRFLTNDIAIDLADRHRHSMPWHFGITLNGISENEIYPKMKVAKFEKLYKLRTAMFIFKNKQLFEVCDSVSYTRSGGSYTSRYPGWRKHHSRIQLRYKGFEIFNKLPAYTRNEIRLSGFKRSIRETLWHWKSMSFNWHYVYVTIYRRL